jgi:hypothetical protein
MPLACTGRMRHEAVVAQCAWTTSLRRCSPRRRACSLTAAGTLLRISGPGTHQITREGAHKGLIHETTPFVLAGCSAHYRLHPRPLNPNKLNLNKLNPNKLNPNKLNPNKLNPNVYWYRIGTGQQRAGCYQ